MKGAANESGQTGARLPITYPTKPTIFPYTSSSPYGKINPYSRSMDARWNIKPLGGNFLKTGSISRSLGHPEINASGQNDRYLNQVIGLDKSAAAL
jgi:hypothetical protein